MLKEINVSCKIKYLEEHSLVKFKIKSKENE